MSSQPPIVVRAIVNAPLSTVWEYWTNPEHIQEWNAASDDWYCPSASNDLRVGGMFTSRMEARDKSFGFDFGGTYTEVIPQARLAYILEDQRTVQVTFETGTGGVHVTETFDPENENPAEMQRAGWQAILDRFKWYVEGSLS